MNRCLFPNIAAALALGAFAAALVLGVFAATRAQNLKNNGWHSEIEALILNGDAEALDEFCKKHPEAVAAIRPGSPLAGADSTNALQIAIRVSTPEVVDVLIRNGAPLGWKGWDPREFLKNKVRLALQEQEEIKRTLKQSAAKDDVPDPEKRLAEMLAETRLGPEADKRIARDSAMLKHLMPIYDEYFKKSAENPVWEILKRRDAKALRKWLDEGGDKNLARSHGETLLFTAYKNADYACVRVLLDRGAAIGNGSLPAHGRKIASELRASILKNRLSDPKNRSRINIRGKDGESPFTRAVLEGMPTNELAIWLENGADPNARDAKGRAIEECFGEKTREECGIRAQSACKEYLEERIAGKKAGTARIAEGMAYRIPDKRTEGIPTDPAVAELKKRWKLRYDADSARYGELRREREKIWKEFQIRHPEFQIDSRDEKGETLLNAVIRAYDLDATELLLSLGADPRATDADGACPAEGMIECARIYDDRRMPDSAETEIEFLCDLLKLVPKMTQKEIDRDLKDIKPLLESEARKQAAFLSLLSKTSSLRAVRAALDAGVFPPDFKDAQGRTLDRIIASDLQENEFVRKSMKELLEKYR